MASHLRGQEKGNPSDLTVAPELSELLRRTSELPSRPCASWCQQEQQQQQGRQHRPSNNNTNVNQDEVFFGARAAAAAAAGGGNRPSSAAACSRRPSSAAAAGIGSRVGSANLRLRHVPTHCPSCSGAPFTDATFFQDDEKAERGDDDDDKDKADAAGPATTTTAAAAATAATTKLARDVAAGARLWVLENGRAVSAPLLALLVVAVSVAWSLYEYAGSSAAALAGPALFAAKACVATSQACYGMVFLPVSRGLVTTLRATHLRRFFDFDNAIKYHAWLAIIGALAGILHGVFVTAAALVWTSRPAEEQVRLGSPRGLSLGDIASTRAFITGWILVLLIAVAYPFATGWPKRSARLRGTRVGAALNSFTNFWLSHHLLIVAFPCVLVAHCVGIPTSKLLSEERSLQHLLHTANKMLLLLLPPLSIYLLERLVRMWRSTRRTPVISARLFPGSSSSSSSSSDVVAAVDNSSSSSSSSSPSSDEPGAVDNKSNNNNNGGGGILELRVRKPRGFRFTAGQYVHLCCPAISSFEWHPFTLASAPQDDFLMIVIKDVGDWTHALHELVRERGEARDGRLILPPRKELGDVANAAAGVARSSNNNGNSNGLTTPSPRSSFNVVAAVSPTAADRAPSVFFDPCPLVANERGMIGNNNNSSNNSILRNRSLGCGGGSGGRDLEAQLSGLPPLCPTTSTTTTTTTRTTTSTLPGTSSNNAAAAAATTSSTNTANNNGEPLTKRVSFAGDKAEELNEAADAAIAAAAAAATKETNKDGGGAAAAPLKVLPSLSLPLPPPSRNNSSVGGVSRRQRGWRRKEDEIPYTFSIDGPWGAPTQEFADYDVVVLLGAGIGVTPMASVLRSLAHELAHARCPNCRCVNEALVTERIRQSRVYFHWILPDNEGVQWFSDVLYGISAADTLGMFDLNLHFTRVDGGGGSGGGGGGGNSSNGNDSTTNKGGMSPAAASAARSAAAFASTFAAPPDAAAAAFFDHDVFDDGGNNNNGTSHQRTERATCGGVAIHSGRPDFDLILGQVKASHPDEHIGVFFCGPGGLSSGIRETCRSLNRRTTTAGGGIVASESGAEGETSDGGGFKPGLKGGGGSFAASESGCSVGGCSNRSSRRGGYGGEISYFEEVFCKNDVTKVQRSSDWKKK